MTKILDEIQATGSTLLPTGEAVPAHSNVGPGSGEVLRHAVDRARLVALGKLAEDRGPYDHFVAF